MCSMDQPLAIYTTRDIDNSSPDSASIEIIGVVVKYSHQWQKVELEFTIAATSLLNVSKTVFPSFNSSPIHRTMEIFETARDKIS